MDNRNKIDGFSDVSNEIENSDEGVSDHPSSIFDDNTGEIDKRSFGSNSGRNSSKTIPDDYERMLKEQEDFLKSLDEQFSSYSTENSSGNETSSLEELLTAYAEPVTDDIVSAPEINIDTEETAEFRIPEIKIADVAENPSAREHEIPEIKIDDLLAETENRTEDDVKVPDVKLDDVSYVEADSDKEIPDLKIDFSEMSVPENLEDTIEIQTFLDDETREIINDLNNMEEPDTYSELVVEDKPVEEPTHEGIPAEQQVEEPEFEEVHFDEPENETYPEEDDVVVVKDNEYGEEGTPLKINGYEPAPYQESEPEEEYNPMFDELLKDEPVDEKVDEFTETDVDEFVEEEVPEWEAFVEQFDSQEEKTAVEEATVEPASEEIAEEPVVEETAEYDPDRMPWEDMVETIDTAENEKVSYEEAAQQPAVQDYELPQIENDETIDYSDLDIQMLRNEYEDEEEETEEDFDDFDIDAYIQENLSHTSNLVFPKFDENGEPVIEEPVVPVEEVNAEIPEVRFDEPEVPEEEEPQEDDDDDYDVEASIHETFANINTELPDFGKEFEEVPVEEAEVTVEDYKPEKPAPAEEPVIEDVPIAEEDIEIPEAEIVKAEIPEIEVPLDTDDDDDYDVEASIHETFASINRDLPDFGKEFEENADEIPVEEVETIVEDSNPETAEFAEEPVAEETPVEDNIVIPEIEVEPAGNNDFNIEIESINLDFADNKEAVELPEVGDISIEASEEPAVEIPEIKADEPEVPEIELPQEDDDDDYDVEASIHETFANINAELPDFGKEYEESAEELKLDLPEEEPAVEEAKAPAFDSFNAPEEKPFVEEHVATGRTAELRGLTDLDMTFMFDDDDSVDNIDSIISEIKDYNIEKGIRNVEDTQINIISEIKKEELMARENEPETEEEPDVASVKPAEKKSFLSSFFGVSEAEIDNYEEDEEEDEKPSENNSDNTVEIPVEEYTEEEIEKTKSSIMKAIADMKPIEEGELLYDDEPALDNEFDAVYTAPQPQPQIQKASSYEDQEHINVLTKQIEKERIAREEMFEQTQQLKLQVSEYENELNDVTNNMSRTNRILNVILTLLIIALFVILFIMGFFFAKERGLI